MFSWPPCAMRRDSHLQCCLEADFEIAAGCRDADENNGVTRLVRHANSAIRRIDFPGDLGDPWPSSPGAMKRNRQLGRNCFVAAQHFDIIILHAIPQWRLSSTLKSGQAPTFGAAEGQRHGGTNSPHIAPFQRHLYEDATVMVKAAISYLQRPAVENTLLPRVFAPKAGEYGMIGAQHSLGAPSFTRGRCSRREAGASRIHLGVGTIALVINATIGAIVLLIVLRVVSGGARGGWGSRWRDHGSGGISKNLGG